MRTKSRSRPFFSKTDFLIIAMLLIFSTTGYMFSKYAEKSVGFSKSVVVRISGEEVYKFSKPGEWKIYNKSGKYVTTLHFDGEKVWVTDSDCPDKICEKTGKVGPGGSIICVPNRTIIEFEKSKFQKDLIDTESW
ncbi:MAG: NusG domain II-containing protein [Fervidobacterium sp.]|uniref:Uncharacterized protein n=1 Tax=Fervidobacterium gondwanense DSM 13020 TaxID=1121883 RepID=A0A1M7RUW5_FERGO|nr:NusG domain II-containing protein [Fervidobacterium gondwanense]UXF01916.1 hypothetical protein IB67_10515 [Fervidobacterium riparium]SHN49974.1 hypothetical protein SAMN02745226_00187 [Fervidobacterium gondwanense DSM 13020]